MLSAYTLNETVHKAKNNSGIFADITSYTFRGSMNESSSDFAFELMSEAVNNAELYTGSEELMIESAMAGSETFDALSEASIKGIKEGAINFYKKIIAMVKGIIEKLKAFLARQTGKTDRWLSIMKPKVEAGISGAKSEITADFNNWDHEYLTSTSGGLVSGVATLKAAWSKRLHVEHAEKRAGQFNRGVSAGGETTEQTRDKYKASHASDKASFNKQGFIDDLAAATKVQGASSSTEAVWAAVTKKATGGEKLSQNILPKAKGMLEAIEGSGKAVTALKNEYESLLKELLDHQSMLSKYEIKNEGAKDDSSEKSANYEMVAEVLRLDQEYTKTYVAAINNIKSMNLNFISKMNLDYMKALTKVAGVKAGKAETPAKEDKKEDKK